MGKCPPPRNVPASYYPLIAAIPRVLGGRVNGIKDAGKQPLLQTQGFTQEQLDYLYGENCVRFVMSGGVTPSYYLTRKGRRILDIYIKPAQEATHEQR